MTANRRAWKIVLGVLGSIVLILGGIIADGHRRAAAVLDRERASVEAQIAAWLARDHARPPGLAEAIDGNAWDDYGPALAQLGALPAEQAELLPRFTESPDDFSPDDHAIHNLILEYRPELERLRRGARRKTVHHRAQTLNARDDLQFIQALQTCKLLADIVAHEHRMGRDDEALATSVLGFALAQDFGRIGTLECSTIQFVGEDVVVLALMEAFEEAPLSPAPLAEFAAALDRLDASRPEFMECLKGEELQVKRSVIDANWDGLFPYFTSLGSKPPHIWPSWRALFSERITRAQALPGYSEIYRSVERLRGLSPCGRVAEAKKLDAEWGAKGTRGGAGNAILDALTPTFGWAFERDAALQMHRSLLRLAIAISRYEADLGRPPESLQALVPKYVREVPLCPLTGQPLRFQAGKVWSVGKNLHDDGGKADLTDPINGGAGDVVWTVKGRK